MTPELLLASRKCDECLASRARIVSGERAAEIIRDCKARGVHFQCHKGQLVGINLHCRANSGRIAFCSASRGSTLIVAALTLGSTGDRNSRTGGGAGGGGGGGGGAGGATGFGVRVAVAVEVVIEAPPAAGALPDNPIAASWRPISSIEDARRTASNASPPFCFIARGSTGGRPGMRLASVLLACTMPAS